MKNKPEPGGKGMELEWNWIGNGVEMDKHWWGDLVKKSCHLFDSGIKTGIFDDGVKRIVIRGKPGLWELQSPYG